MLRFLAESGATFSIASPRLSPPWGTKDERMMAGTGFDSNAIYSLGASPGEPTDSLGPRNSSRHS
jgi:hypothetical protein